MRLYDLKEKEVINVCDCRRLGFVSDVVFEFPSGHIAAFIVPGPIPFEDICQVGDDIILVDVKVEEILQKCEGF